jgi:hypothetical protein
MVKGTSFAITTPYRTYVSFARLGFYLKKRKACKWRAVWANTWPRIRTGMLNFTACVNSVLGLYSDESPTICSFSNECFISLTKFRLLHLLGCRLLFELSTHEYGSRKFKPFFIGFGTRGPSTAPYRTSARTSHTYKSASHYISVRAVFPFLPRAHF